MGVVDEGRSQGRVFEQPGTGAGDGLGAVGHQEMDVGEDVQSLGADGGRDHGDAVGEGFEDLHPGAAAVAQGDDHQVGPGQLFGDIRNLARKGHRRGVVEGGEGRRSQAHQPDADVGDEGAESGTDVVDEKTRRIGVGRIPQGALEGHDGRVGDGEAAERMVGEGVAVADDADARELRARRVEVAADDGGRRFIGDASVESAPPTGVLLGEDAGGASAEVTGEALDGAGQGQAGTDLLVLEIVDVDHGGGEGRRPGQHPGPNLEVPDEVIGARRELAQGPADDGAGATGELEGGPGMGQCPQVIGGLRWPVVDGDAFDASEPECRGRGVEVGTEERDGGEEVDLTATGQRLQCGGQAQARAAVARPRVLRGHHQSPHRLTDPPGRRDGSETHPLARTPGGARAETVALSPRGTAAALPWA